MTLIVQLTHLIPIAFLHIAEKFPEKRIVEDTFEVCSFSKMRFLARYFLGCFPKFLLVDKATESCTSKTATPNFFQKYSKRYKTFW